ncbi:jg3206 [Pararge aegeria aegeria]|uniref:Jg3206 protein n=1 Tax=Pararge aegeria aegeria TaxID=348720 RepID=A0A8S4RNC7_9NEOP|nr:jg3206 [Pararge aegeria aegeria]
MPRTQDFLDEPTMSDTTILVTVEDLINRAMGPTDANVVNFKLIQTILHILARQQRMLQQRVEIRIIEIRKEERSRRKKHGDESTEEKSSIENPSPGIVKAHKSPQRGDKKDKPPSLDIRDKVQQKDRADRKEHKRDEKIKSKEKGEITSYETKQMQMMVNKIEEEEEEVIIKETKGQGKFKKLPQKETEEKGQQESNKISQKEKGKWETEEKMDQKEPDKRSQKERDKEKKAGQRESNTYTESESEGQQPEIALIKMDIEEKLGNREPEKEREIWGNEGQQREKEKNRLADPNVVAQKEPEQMMQKEMERWEKQKKIEQKEPQKMTQAERDIWKKMGPEKTGKIAQKEKERLEREDIKEERSRLYEQKTEKERSAREPDLDRKKTAQRSNIEITG